MKKLLLSLCLFAALSATAQDTTTHHRIICPPVNILIDIPDLEINETVIKCRATLFAMIYNLKTESLSLSWTVKYYADSAGSYGKYLGGDIGGKITIPDKSKEIIADNYTFVNPMTGEILHPDALGNYSMDYLGQYDFLNRYAESKLLNIHDMIRQYGQQITNWGN